MRAAVYMKYGSPSHLTLTDVRKSTPGDDEFLIKVCAVSINDWDWQLLMGIPLANRLSNDLFNSGKVRPVIDKRFPLEALPEAMLYFGQAKQIGKVVIRIDRCKDS